MPDLARILDGLDGAPYARLAQLRGRSPLGPGVELVVARVQPDPFAPPSRLELHVDPPTAALDPADAAHPDRARALASLLARTAAATGGPFRIDAGGQEVLTRSSAEVGPDGAVVLRFGYSFPGPRRRVDARAVRRDLLHRLPELARTCLRAPVLDPDALTRFLDTVEDAAHLRRALPGLGLVAFVADGAVLPRRSGVDDRPAERAVPFRSPESLRVTVELPRRGPVSGMGVPEGVTVVVGGGFHGKSTLLRALELGVYDHVPGDGRELVVTRPAAVAVRAEDGRAVTAVDVSTYVSGLPGGLDPSRFSTADASGSTSQAAAVAEAWEVGSPLLLIDEDTAATNLMVRDARMQRLVEKAAEPLNPLVDLVRPMHREHGVSTVLVVGASGDFLDVADRVLLLQDYVCSDVTGRAREVAALATGRRVEAGSPRPPRPRVPDPTSVRPAGDRVKLAARGTDTLRLGETDVDVRSVRQLTDAAQVLGVGRALLLAVDRGLLDGRRTLAELCPLLAAELAGPTGSWADPGGGDVAVPRMVDLVAVLSRTRGLRVL
ncbi:P-loop domain-containing protein [Kineococcus gynurae]|uniref:P-loop domain-containing protein n=1 Tax=Kineococcus gynurae TaxID=452979 RepID=A0ABV5LSU8_9ACTN